MKGKTPVLFTFVDDSQGSKLLSTNKQMLQLCLRHRHLGQMKPPRGGAVGMSLFVSTHTFKSNGGLNKAIRSNCTSHILFKTKDMTELKQIAEAFSGEIAVDRFFQDTKQLQQASIIFYMWIFITRKTFSQVDSVSVSILI